MHNGAPGAHLGFIRATAVRSLSSPHPDTLSIALRSRPPDGFVNRPGARTFLSAPLKVLSRPPGSFVNRSACKTGLNSPKGVTVASECGRNPRMKSLQEPVAGQLGRWCRARIGPKKELSRSVRRLTGSPEALIIWRQSPPPETPRPKPEISPPRPRASSFGLRISGLIPLTRLLATHLAMPLAENAAQDA